MQISLEKLCVPDVHNGKGNSPLQRSWCCQIVEYSQIKHFDLHEDRGRKEVLRLVIGLFWSHDVL